MEGHHQSVNVKEGEGMEQDVSFGPMPGLVERLQIVDQVAVGNHGPLGPAGGPGGVAEERRVFLGSGIRKIPCRRWSWVKRRG